MSLIAVHNAMLEDVCLQMMSYVWRNRKKIYSKKKKRRKLSRNARKMKAVSGCDVHWFLEKNVGLNRDLGSVGSCQTWLCVALCTIWQYNQAVACICCGTYLCWPSCRYLSQTLIMSLSFRLLLFLPACWVTPDCPCFWCNHKILRVSSMVIWHPEA